MHWLKGCVAVAAASIVAGGLTATAEADTVPSLISAL
jgi:hypothetical protein